MDLKFNIKLLKTFVILIVFVSLFSLARTLSSLIPLGRYFVSDLNCFCILVAAIATFTVYLLLFRPRGLFILNLKRRIIVSLLLILTIMSFSGAIINLISPEYKHVVLMPWYDIAHYSVLVSLSTMLLLTYVPAYFLNRCMLKCKWTFLEKAIFYPIISLTILGGTNLLLSLLNLHRYTTWSIILLVTSIIFIWYLVRLLRNGKSVVLNIDALEVLGLLLAIAFRLFVFYSAIGDNFLLRGDALFHIHQMAFVNKFNIIKYYYIYRRPYPVLFPLYWLAIANACSIPLINMATLIATFNQVFSIISMYAFVKLLTGSRLAGTISVILWTTLSGFGWISSIESPPEESLTSPSAYLEYISHIAGRFSYASPPVHPPTYIGGHTLVRFWGLCVYLVALVAIVQYYMNYRSPSYLFILSLSILHLTFGHPTELTLVALALASAQLLFGHRVNRDVLLPVSLSTLVGTIYHCLLGYPLSWCVLTLMPLLSLVISKLFRYGPLLRNLALNLKGLCVVYLFFCGLMYIAFALKYNTIYLKYPLYTLWYFPAIEWGFLGVISNLSICLLTLSDSVDLRRGFALLLMFLQLFLLFILNLINYHLSFIIIPFPFQPVLFYYILATIGSFVVLINRPRHSRLLRILSSMVIALLIIVGSMDYLLSVNFWRLSTGRYTGTRTVISEEDIQMINFLYRLDIDKPYIITPYSILVVHLSGMATLPPLFQTAFLTTRDCNELNFILTLHPSKYILMRKPHEYTLFSTSPIFENKKYKLIPIPSWILAKPSVIPSTRDLIAISKVFFNNSRVILKTSNKFLEYNVCNGTIESIGGNYVLIYLESLNKKENITLYLPNIYIEGETILMNLITERRITELKSLVLPSLSIEGVVSFKVVSTFENRIYIENFTYRGGLCPKEFSLKELMDEYIKNHDISILSVLLHPLGLLWSFTIIPIIVLMFSKRVRRLISITLKVYKL